jgi:hypothetical protein
LDHFNEGGSPDTVFPTTAPAVAVVSDGSIAMTLKLDFVEDSEAALAAATSQMIEQGRTVALDSGNERARAIIEAAGGRCPSLRMTPAEDKIVLLSEGRASSEPDAWTLLESDGHALAAELMKFSDLDAGDIVAPITDRHSSRNAVFMISIPKSGTHLAYEVLNWFGYHRGETAPQKPRPQHWYFIDKGTPHTDAPSFLFNHPWQQQGEYITHPFHGSAAVFIYRHPYDVLLSEANWYSIINVKGYLAGLSPNAVVARLANDPWLFGSLRDRIAKFVAWLNFPNVIPISYEELVGPRGGGSARRQRALIWSMQLKLQVAGAPDVIADKIYNPRSATFRVGQAGAYRSLLPAEARQELALLPTDYLDVFGYSADFEVNGEIYPRRANEFRRRPLIVSRPSFAPELIEQDYLGFNIVLYKDKFFGVRISDGPVNLSALDDAALTRFHHANNLNWLRFYILEELYRTHSGSSSRAL